MIETYWRRLIIVVISTGFLHTAIAQTHSDWLDSLSVLNKQIDRAPHSVELRLRKAAVNIELGQWEYAIDEYGRVLSLDEDNLTALYFRAYANTHIKRYDLAVNDYRSILSRVPRHFEAQLGLAMVLQQMERTSEAVDVLNQLIQMFPDSATAYVARASLEMNQKQYELSLYDWDEAMKINPDNIDYLVSKVEVLLMMKQKKQARRLLQQAISQGASQAALKQWLDRCR